MVVCEGAGQAPLKRELPLRQCLRGCPQAVLPHQRKKQTHTQCKRAALARQRRALTSTVLLQVPAQMQAHDTSARGPGAPTSEVLCDGLEARGGAVNEPGCVVRTCPMHISVFELHGNPCMQVLLCTAMQNSPTNARWIPAVAPRPVCTASRHVGAGLHSSVRAHALSHQVTASTPVTGPALGGRPGASLA